MQSLKWHEDNCPCKGKPQAKSKRLEARQSEVPVSGPLPLGNGVKMFFRKPGSQNAKK